MASSEVALDVSIRKYLAASLSESTKRVYRCQLRSYLSFCNNYGYQPAPASATTVMRYVAHLAQRLSYRSIRQYLVIVQAIHDGVLPGKKQVTMILKGIRRIKGDSINRKLPMTPEVLLAIRQRLNLRSVNEATFWCACLFAFYGMLRKSSLFPPGRMCLRAKQIQVFKKGLILSLMYSKTVQYRERKTFVVLPLVLDGDIRLCPVRALLAAWELAGVSNASHPLLPLVTLGKLVPMSATCFTKKLLTLLSDLGLSGYSGHSFRRGGASHALSCGVPAEVIMAQGDWKSMAYLDYLSVDQVHARSLHLEKMV